MIWCGNYTELSSDKMERYFKNENDLLNKKPQGFQLKRLINNKSGIIKEKDYKTHLNELAKSKHQGKYICRQCDIEHYEIVYADYKNQLTTKYRALLVLLDGEGIPHLGFYFDNGKDESHKQIIMTIRNIFEKEWSDTLK